MNVIPPHLRERWTPDGAVREVLVVFKTHLDIGFTAPAADVVRLYQESFIPDAMDMAERTRSQPYRFVWTTGSWLVHHFLDHAPARLRRRMVNAIEAGDFHWHALPFTTHTELLSPSLFAAGLEISRRLDRRFRRRTTGAKMTDVPGHTIGMVPPMHAAGVRLLHIGVNPASTTPGVPPVFRWKLGGAEIVVVYQSVYGAPLRIPGSPLAVAVHLTNDNQGPPSAHELAGIYEALHERYPAARLVPSSLTAVADRLWRMRRLFPVLEKEIGDSWIHGAGTDPGKVSAYRALSRLREEAIARGALRLGDARDRAVSESLLLVAEHTWGLDEKTHLGDHQAYAPRDFARASKRESFQRMEASWEEQRSYLKQAARSFPPRWKIRAGAALRPIAAFGHVGRRSEGVPAAVELGPWKMSFCGETGAITGLIHLPSGRQLADRRHRLAALSYQTFSDQDYGRFFRQYNTWAVDWAVEDFTKPGIELAGAISQQASPVPRGWSRRNDTLVLELAWPKGLPGAPASAWMRISPAENMEAFDLALHLGNKPACRLPEGLWVSFTPRGLPAADWRLDKLGSWLDPWRVTARGGRFLHAVGRGVRCGEFGIVSTDAPLVAPGEPSLLNFPKRGPRPSAGMHFNLYNNVWGTNFPMWYSDDIGARFRIGWGMFS